MYDTFLDEVKFNLKLFFSSGLIERLLMSKCYSKLNSKYPDSNGEYFYFSRIYYK